MLGDIVSTPTKPNAAAARPVRQSAVGGYGSSDFGQAARPAAPRPVAVAPKPAPAAHTAPAAPSAPVRSTTVASSVAAAPVISRPVALPSSIAKKKRRGSKLPLILMIVGIVVFVGGVAAMFIYALGGK